MPRNILLRVTRFPALLLAALTPEIQPTASPGSRPSPPLGAQYFTLYDRRWANLSNSPADSQRSFASATWTPGDWFALPEHLRAHRDRNDKLNHAPWSDSAVAPSAEAWIALSPRTDITAGYALAHRTTDTLFVIPYSTAERAGLRWASSARSTTACAIGTTSTRSGWRPRRRSTSA